MKLEAYKQIQRAVAAGMGIVVAIGVVLNNFLLPLAGITLGMLFLFLSGRNVKERISDERTATINLKSSQATLSITIVALSIVGLALIMLSRTGYLPYEELGFQIAMLGLLIMALKAFFDWYYRNRFGG
jgi:uncharacterized membrane protein